MDPACVHQVPHRMTCEHSTYPTLPVRLPALSFLLLLIFPIGEWGTRERKMPFSPLVPTISKYHLLPVQPTSVDRFDWPSLSPVCPSGPPPWPLGLSDPFPASAAPPLPCAAPPVAVSPPLSKRQIKSIKSLM